MPAMDRAAGPNPAPPFIWMNTLNQAPNLKHHITPVRAGWFWDRFALHRRQASSHRPVNCAPNVGHFCLRLRGPCSVSYRAQAAELHLDTFAVVVTDVLINSGA